MTPRRAARRLAVVGLVAVLALGFVEGGLRLTRNHRSPLAAASTTVPATRREARTTTRMVSSERLSHPVANRRTAATPPAHAPVAHPPVAHPPAARTTAPAAAGAAPAERPVVGAYLGPGNVAGATVLSTRLPAGLPTILDYLDGTTWWSLTSASPTWLSHRWAPTGEAPTYLVPLLPATGGSLAVGATGAYDPWFARLAAVLVAGGEAHATLVLGWSPLEQGHAWSVTTPAEGPQYVAFFRHVVTTMRAVPGARFRFSFQPGPVADDPPVRPGSLYPGNAFVDTVDIAVFDGSTSSPTGAQRWAVLRDGLAGPAWTARFARRHHRPIVVDGLAVVPRSAGGPGDDPAFVSSFLAWARRARVETIYLWADGSWALDLQEEPQAFTVLRQVVARWDASTKPAPTAGRPAGSGGTAHP